MNSEYHNSVLLQQSVDGLNIKESGVYIDATFGGGGHSREILKRLGKNGRLYAFDQDEDALQNDIDDKRFVLINDNFRYIGRFLKNYGIEKVDGILADLGVSSHQFNVPERGFSTRFDADLDMRMSKKNDLDAYIVLNTYEESELRKIFTVYGELTAAAAISKTIVEKRSIDNIRGTEQLKIVLKRFLPAHKSNKILAQIYQAIRIEVNQEMESLKKFLEESLRILESGGRISVISYHSLEDRLVKRFFKNGQFQGEAERDFYGNITVPFKTIERLIVPSKEEIKLNNRARSAKLRISEKI